MPDAPACFDAGQQAMQAVTEFVEQGGDSPVSSRFAGAVGEVAQSDWPLG
jgi:hypothetical protein